MVFEYLGTRRCQPGHFAGEVAGQVRSPIRAFTDVRPQISVEKLVGTIVVSQLVRFRSGFPVLHR